MLFVLDIMQVTFATEPIVDLPTTGFNSKGMGKQTKMSNFPKHVPTSSTSTKLVPAPGTY